VTLNPGLFLHRKHPTTPRFAEDYNRTAEARIGYWGKVPHLALCPVGLSFTCVQIDRLWHTSV